MNIEKETSKEIRIVFLTSILLMFSPLIISNIVWLCEEFDNYQYCCKDTFGNCYYVEHINKGFNPQAKTNQNGENITIVQYKKVKK